MTEEKKLWNYTALYASGGARYDLDLALMKDGRYWLTASDAPEEWGTSVFMSRDDLVAFKDALVKHLEEDE